MRVMIALTLFVAPIACTIGQEASLEESIDPTTFTTASFPGYHHQDSWSTSDPPPPVLAETPVEPEERAAPSCSAAPAGSFNVGVTVNGPAGGNLPWIFGSNFTGYTPYVQGIDTWNTQNGISSEDLATLESRLLRTPGGCVSESYFWDERDTNGTTLIQMINANGNRTIPTLSIPEFQTIIDDAATAQNKWFDHLHTLNLSFDAQRASYLTPCNDRPQHPTPMSKSVTELVDTFREISLFELGNEPWGNWPADVYDATARLAAAEISRLNGGQVGIIGVGYPLTMHDAATSQDAATWNSYVRDMYLDGTIDYVADHPYMASGLRVDRAGELTRLNTLFMEEDRSHTGERHCMVDAKYGPAFGTCQSWANSTISSSPTAIATTEFRRVLDGPRHLLKMSILNSGTQLRWSTCPLDQNGAPGTCTAAVTEPLDPVIPNLEVAGFEDPTTRQPKLLMLRTSVFGSQRFLNGRICTPATNNNTLPFAGCSSTWVQLMELPSNVDPRLGYAAYIRDQNDGVPRLVLVFMSDQDRTLVRGCNLAASPTTLGYTLACGDWANENDRQDGWYLPPNGRDRLLDLAAWVGHMPYDGYPELPEWGAAAWMATDNLPRVIDRWWFSYNIPAHRLAFTEWNINWDGSQVAGTMSHNMFIFETLMIMAKRNVPIGIFHQLGRGGGCCSLFEDDPSSNDPMGLRLAPAGRSFALAAGMAGHEARSTAVTVEHRSLGAAPECSRENLGCFSGASLPLVSVHAGREWATGDAVLLISNRDPTRSAALDVDLRSIPEFAGVPQEDMVIEQKSLFATSFSSKALVEDNKSCRLPAGGVGPGRIQLHVPPISMTLVRITVKRRWVVELAAACPNGATPLARPAYVSWLRFGESWQTRYTATGSIELPISSVRSTDALYVHVADAATGQARAFRPPPPSPAIEYVTAFNPPTPVAHWDNEDLDDGVYALRYTALPSACP